MLSDLLSLLLLFCLIIYLNYINNTYLLLSLISFILIGLYISTNFKIIIYLSFIFIFCLVFLSNIDTYEYLDNLYDNTYDFINDIISRCI